MEIFLVRHGIAVERESEGPDAFRPLTEKGRRRFRKTARSFARLGCKLDLVLTSPLVRAVQTAEILAGEAKHGEVGILEELDPKYDAADLLKALRKRANGSRSVALVGHEPQLSSVLAALAGVEAESLDLKKGAIVRLEARDPSQRGSAAAIWSLKPRSKTVKKGLPLAKAEGDEEKPEERAAKGKRSKRAASRRSAKKRSRRARHEAESSETADTSAGSTPDTAAEEAANTSEARSEATGADHEVSDSAPSNQISRDASDSPAAPT
jgi:phosphohistidine phosphatase